MKWFLAFLFPAFFLLSCEKKIDLDLDDDVPKLVVEGVIENGEAPRVVLTQSIGYFSTLTPEQLTQSFVRNAEVYVSNGTTTHRLKEFAVPLGNGINLYYYSNDPADPATAFTGELNQQYNLKVVSGGKEYTATTSILDTTKSIDSVWWRPVPNSTTRAQVLVRVTDPPGFGNYLRYYTRINSEPQYLAPFSSVFDDLFIDGSTYEVQVQRGFDRNEEREEEDEFFHRGDTISFKVSTIDKATYDFWRTWEFSYGSVGNPFSTPTRVLGNISNGALGYFAGYANQYRSLIIPQ